MNIFRPYYSNYKHVHVCTCGYWGERKYGENKCPECGTNMTYLSDNDRGSTESKIVKVLNPQIEDKSFDITKTRYLTRVVAHTPGPGYSLEIVGTEVYRVVYDFMDDQKLEIYKDGVLIKNTKANMQKALSFVNLTDKEKGLFKSVAYYSDESTASGILDVILNNPQLEIFYNTYGNLVVIKDIPLSIMDRSKTAPHEILGISRPVWKSMLAINEDAGCGINKHFQAIRKMDRENPNNPDYVVNVLKRVRELGFTCFDDYLHLIFKGYDYEHLYQYLTDDIYTYQGISDPEDGLTLLKDYVDMSENMGTEYDRYPKSLKLVHDMASKNLQIKVSKEQQALFNEVLNKEDYSSLEYKGTYYSVINPTTTDDIVEEGRRLHHCVGSYVNKVIKGETKITFLRSNDDRKKPLITLEVRDDTLRQYRGNCERKPNTKEMNFIHEWAAKKDLLIW